MTNPCLNVVLPQPAETHNQRLRLLPEPAFPHYYRPRLHPRLPPIDPGYALAQIDSLRLFTYNTETATSGSTSLSWKPLGCDAILNIIWIKWSLNVSQLQTFMLYNSKVTQIFVIWNDFNGSCWEVQENGSYLYHKTNQAMTNYG